MTYPSSYELKIVAAMQKMLDDAEHKPPPTYLEICDIIVKARDAYMKMKGPVHKGMIAFYFPSSWASELIGTWCSRWHGGKDHPTGPPDGWPEFSKFQNARYFGTYINGSPGVVLYCVPHHKEDRI